MARYSTKADQNAETKERITRFTTKIKNMSTTSGVVLGIENFTSQASPYDPNRKTMIDIVAREAAASDSSSASFGRKLSKAQQEAGATIMAIGTMGTEAIAAYHNAATANIPAINREGVRDSNQVISGTAGVTSKMGLEYFNNEVAIDKHIGASIEFNMQAARQNPEWEHMFPTVTLDPSDIGMEVDINILYVHQQVRHTMNRKDNAGYKRRNILDSVTDPHVFDDNTIKFFPYFQEGANASYREFFVPEALHEPTFPISDSHAVRTNPLLFGTAAKPLLSLSAHPGSVGSSTRDETDEFDPRFRLRDVYVLVSSPEEDQSQLKGKLVRYSTLNLPKAAFQAAQEGNARTMMLMFRDSRFTIDGSNEDVVGAEIPALAELKNGGYRVTFTMRVNAEVNLQDGIEKYSEANMEILNIVDKDGVEVDMTKGPGKVMLESFKMKVIGYNYDNTLSNQNRRSRGTLLDNQVEIERLKTTLQSPITMQRPVNNGGVAPEEDQVANLILAARLRNNAQAGTKLLNYEEALGEVVKAHINKYDVANIEGVGRWYVHPWYEALNFDAEEQIAALASSDVAGELRAALLNTLRDQITRAYRETRFGPALQAYTKYAVSVPKVGILTDPVIRNWLWQSGDNRTLGEGFEYYIDETYDDRFVDTIRWYFSTTEDSFNALHFGAFLWIPELVVTTSMSRDNRIADELTVQPRCEHVVNTPIMGRINVLNMHKYIGSAPSISVRTRTPLDAAIDKENVDGNVKPAA